MQGMDDFTRQALYIIGMFFLIFSYGNLMVANVSGNKKEILTCRAGMFLGFYIIFGTALGRLW